MKHLRKHWEKFDSDSTPHIKCLIAEYNGHKTRRESAEGLSAAVIVGIDAALLNTEREIERAIHDHQTSSATLEFAKRTTNATVWLTGATVLLAITEVCLLVKGIIK
ncbi:MAG: hypothetical protein JST16_18160 [Bdellovibrionales bacterium]|nr:hypothetical protein [Bdellovibrionales bacterium]